MKKCLKAAGLLAAGFVLVSLIAPHQRSRPMKWS